MNKELFTPNEVAEAYEETEGKTTDAQKTRIKEILDSITRHREYVVKDVQVWDEVEKTIFAKIVTNISTLNSECIDSVDVQGLKNEVTVWANYHGIEYQVHVKFLMPDDWKKYEEVLE